MPSTADISKLIQKLQTQGKLPAGLGPAQLAKLQTALQKYGGQVSQRVLQDILDDFSDKLATASSMTSPETIRGAVADLTELVGSVKVGEKIKFALKISQEVSSGAGSYLNQNLSPEAVDEFPALALQRMFDRDLPRGFKRGKGGVVTPDPDDAWPARWAEAGEDCGDDDWLPWEGDSQAGRGVALKSSGIWQSLGDGAGDYDDTLGNPFPPFAFNSGFMTVDVSRADAEKLGLLDKGEEAEPAKINFANLFAEVGS